MSTWKWVGRKLVEEIVGTLSQETTPMPGDFFTPLGEIGLEVGRGVGKAAGRIKSWSQTKKCIVCRSTPTCPGCKKCGSHCKCAPVAEEEKRSEWMCNYCGTPQPEEYRKCDSCGAARPFLR